MFDAQKKCYFIESNSDDLSIIPIAQLLYSLNHLQSCAYINVSITSHETISMLEQLFLRTQVLKEYSYVHLDYYVKYKDSLFTRGIISRAEYQNVVIENLKEVIERNSYQVLIVEGLDKNHPYYTTICEIINESLSEQVIIIGSVDIMNSISIPITQQFRLDYNKETNLELFPHFNVIKASPLFSSWIVIAQLFLTLKNSNQKRIFFMSSHKKFVKEIFFISLLKKYVKTLQNFGTWDYVFVDDVSNQSYKEADVLYESFAKLLYQSFQIDGYTALIFSQDNTMNDDLMSYFDEMMQKKVSLEKNSSYKSLVFVNSNSNLIDYEDLSTIIYSLKNTQ